MIDFNTINPEDLMLATAFKTPDVYGVEFLTTNGDIAQRAFKDFSSMFKAWKKCSANWHAFDGGSDWTDTEIDTLNTVEDYSESKYF